MRRLRSRSNPEDYELKWGLCQDVVDVIDLEGNLTGEERRVGGFDLVYHGGPVNMRQCNIGAVYEHAGAKAARKKKYGSSTRTSPRKGKRSPKKRR